MKFCPRNAHLYGVDVSKDDADAWCKRSRDAACAGCDMVENESEKKAENPSTTKEQLKLFSG
jgi:hypothetical protein